MTSIFTPEWYYFGCGCSAGHFTFARGMRHTAHNPIDKFDGILAPFDTDEQFIAAGVIRLPHLGLSALSFWDRTIDSRPGSNSSIFAPSNSCDARAILLGAARYFPEVYARWPSINIRSVT